MKDSIQSAIAPDPTGSSHIRAACRRVEAMGSSVGNPVQPPTVFELEEALAERVQTCELLGKELAKPGLSSPTRERRCCAGETGSYGAVGP